MLSISNIHDFRTLRGWWNEDMDGAGAPSQILNRKPSHLCTSGMHQRPNFKEIITHSPIIIIIGVVGDSGSGKTTFTNAIRQIFGPELVATITLDDYHRYGREERDRLDITPLHPDANNLPQLESDIVRLKAGRQSQNPSTTIPPGRWLPRFSSPRKRS